MRNRKFIIGFLIFDIVAVLVIALVLIIKNPFKRKVAPNTDPTTAYSTSSPEEQPSDFSEASTTEFVQNENTEIYTTMPELAGMRVTSTLTDDGCYYTSYKADVDMDMDGDGEIESVSISLDDHSECFYVLVNDNGTITDCVVPGLEYTYKEKYGCKACKGALQAYTLDLNTSDVYTEVAIELNRDNWFEYGTIVVRYDGSRICVSVVSGKLSGVSNAGEVQFFQYDFLSGKHKLYRTYSTSADLDFLRPQTDYFVDTDVERNELLMTLDYDVECEDSHAMQATLKAGTSFYWYSTDNESVVYVIASDGVVYRLPITSETVEDENGTSKRYQVAGHASADF